jgi:hypothetical protein
MVQEAVQCGNEAVRGPLHTPESLQELHQLIPIHGAFISPSVKCHCYLLEEKFTYLLIQQTLVEFYLHMLVPVVGSTSTKMKST